MDLALLDEVIESLRAQASSLRALLYQAERRDVERKRLRWAVTEVEATVAGLKVYRATTLAARSDAYT